VANRPVAGSRGPTGNKITKGPA